MSKTIDFLKKLQKRTKEIIINDIKYDVVTVTNSFIETVRRESDVLGRWFDKWEHATDEEGNKIFKNYKQFEKYQIHKVQNMIETDNVSGISIKGIKFVGDKCKDLMIRHTVDNKLYEYFYKMLILVMNDSSPKDFSFQIETDNHFYEGCWVQGMSWEDCICETTIIYDNCSLKGY